MRENKVISAVISYRHAYDSIFPYYERGDFSDLGEIIYKEVGKYYERDPEAEYVDADSLLGRLTRMYSKHREQFEKFFDDMPDVSVDNLLDDYRATKMDSLGERAGSYLLAGEHDKAAELLDKYQQLREEGLQAAAGQEESVVYQGATVDDIADTFAQENRIPLHPKELNEALNGGLRPGDHCLFYATPEMGKTACAITQAFSIAYRGKTVLYVGNEDPADAYLMRMKSRFTGMTEEEILADRDKADKIAIKNGWDNLIFAHMSPGTTDEVKRLALEHGVQAVVLDQLHNLKHSQKPKLEGTQLLTELAYTMRMFYSKHKITGISFTQADEKAEGKLFLGIKNVYYSNIGVQGQTDVMVGMGADANHVAMHRRALTFTKNKVGGDHGHKIVGIKPQTSSIISIGK